MLPLHWVCPGVKPSGLLGVLNCHVPLLNVKALEELVKDPLPPEMEAPYPPPLTLMEKLEIWLEVASKSTWQLKVPVMSCPP